MKDNVILFPRSDVDPNVILEKAKDWGLEEVLIIGIRKGELVWGGSTVDISEILYLMWLAEKDLSARTPPPPEAA